MNSETFLHIDFENRFRIARDRSIHLDHAESIEVGTLAGGPRFEALETCVWNKRRGVRMAENIEGNLRHQAWPSRHIYVLV